MPKKPINSKDALDRFYTKPCVAKMCIDILEGLCLNVEQWIEPSAGSGAFSSQKACRAFDLSPAYEGITQLNWFDYRASQSVLEGATWGVFGNPPFGRANSLSKAFIKHAIKEGCSVVAFILPNTFDKLTTQKVFPSNWKLISKTRLPDGSFMLNDTEYHVPCSFYVWTQLPTELSDLREVVSDYTTDELDFCKEGELFMFGASPSKLIGREYVLPNNRGYYLTSSLSFDILSTKLKDIPWKDEAMSSVNGGVAWFTQAEILKIWRKYYEREQFVSEEG
jgi:hypothetical protein